MGADYSWDVDVTPESTKVYPALMYGAIASIGAGLIHGGAIGIHAEHPQLARLFIAVAVAQVAWGVMVLLRPQGWLLLAGLAINAVAVAGWLVTRLSGVSWIDGLEIRESAQITDSLCAALGAIAASTAMAALIFGKIDKPSPSRLASPSVLFAIVTVVAMWNGATHLHATSDTTHATSDTTHATSDTTHATSDTTHATSDTAHATSDTTHATSDTTHAGVVLENWPRAFDPSLPLDISNVEGVSPEQELRAANLIKETGVKLLHWADPKTAYAEGWRSIRDTVTGFEHYQNYSLYDDDKFLDPTAPESLVYKVGLGGQRTLVSAMFMAKTKVPMDSPILTDYAGSLMQWHIHDNLCFFSNGKGAPFVVGVTNAQGVCAFGTRAPGDNAMVHVWIVPHECGPFAALEGVGAGSAIVSEADRRDKCGDHTHPA